jgi:dolichyl-phosphate-mannose--protein O-mannosyl transferase
MGKIDKIKESLSTLRAVLAIFIAVIVAISGSLVTSYRTGVFDSMYWIGIFLVFSFSAAVGILFIKIHRLTNEIEDL